MSRAVYFRRIVCGIDATRTGFEAARQAIVLTPRGGELHFVCVASVSGAGTMTAMSELSPARGEQALEQAVRMARQAGVNATEELVHSVDVNQALSDRAQQHDLLVVGSHGHSRASGILLGSSASAAVHKPVTSVLIARGAPGDTQFPKKMLVASDASEQSMAAVKAATEIAQQHQSTVLLLHVGKDGTEVRTSLAAQTAHITEQLGREPTLVEEGQHALATIVGVAEREHVPLVVVGTRELGGSWALGSVSERVAHEVPCSVLVVKTRKPSP